MEFCKSYKRMHIVHCTLFIHCPVYVTGSYFQDILCFACSINSYIPKYFYKAEHGSYIAYVCLAIYFMAINLK